jgi:hypothetical protein
MPVAVSPFKFQVQGSKFRSPGILGCGQLENKNAR